MIPYVVEAVPEKRPKNAKPIEPPKKCPSCGEKVEKEADTPYIRCVNPACPAQLKERLRWFCGRSQMDIEGLGDKLIDQLVDRGIVKTFADLYSLKADQIATLTSETDAGVTRTVGEKVAAKVLANVEGSRKQGLDRLLGRDWGFAMSAIAWRMCWRAILARSTRLAKSGSQEELSDVDEIGPKRDRRIGA